MIFRYDNTKIRLFHTASFDNRFHLCLWPANHRWLFKQAAFEKWYWKGLHGREIASVMSFDGVDWLERNSRMQEEQTAAAIRKLPISKNSVVADVGAGSGFYTFRIAKRVPDGKVYAVEIQDDAIDYLKQKSNALKLNNVEVVKGSAKQAGLQENTIDLVIMVDVYHELEYPREFLDAVKKALKPGGKLLLLEYKAEDPAVKIKAEHKMSVAQVQRELGASGYRLVQRGDFLPLQHFLVFEKD